MRWIYQGENRTLRARSDFDLLDSVGHACTETATRILNDKSNCSSDISTEVRYGTPSWLHTHSYFYTNSKRRLLCSM